MTTNIECTLHRLTESDEGTFGIFAAPSLGFSCVSLELPDRANTPMKSRIPAGNYLTNWGYSNRFKRDMYRLDDVPGRVGILIHPANFAGDVLLDWKSDLSGCIALGLKRGQLTNNFGAWQSALLDSKHTVRDFEALAAQARLLISIFNPAPQAPDQPLDLPSQTA